MLLVLSNVDTLNDTFSDEMGEGALMELSYIYFLVGAFFLIFFWIDSIKN
jgi:hypothetical protein